MEVQEDKKNRGLNCPHLKTIYKMETTIKLLCTEQEAKALLDLVPPTRFIQMIQNDPTWGYIGSGDFYVVYIDNSHGYYTPSVLFRLGMDLNKKIAKN